MSSNQYGFTCNINWKGRTYDIQVVFAGTHESEIFYSEHIMNSWESLEPSDLAKYELENRDWSKKFNLDKRIGVWFCLGGWLPDDPNDINWSPPIPNEREILELLASGEYTNLEYGWDT